MKKTILLVALMGAIATTTFASLQPKRAKDGSRDKGTYQNVVNAVKNWWNSW